MYPGRYAPRPPAQKGALPHELKPNYQVGFTMGFRIMRLVTLWLVASSEAFRVHGASATHGAKGVQGGGGHESTKTVNNKATGSHNVCNVGDSPATCRELTAKYRGGGESVSTFSCPCNVHVVASFGGALSHRARIVHTHRNQLSSIHFCAFLIPRLPARVGACFTPTSKVPVRHAGGVKHWQILNRAGQLFWS